MTIRPLALNEVPALVALARRTYTQAFGPDMAPDDLAFVMEERLSAAHFEQAVAEDVILVAEEEGALIGFVQFGDNRIAEAGAPGDQEIRRLYVTAERQGRGIGGALMRAALAHPRIPAGATVLLTVWEDNAQAQAFYRRHGFEAVGTCRLMLANGPADGRELIMARGPGGGLVPAKAGTR